MLIFDCFGVYPGVTVGAPWGLGARGGGLLIIWGVGWFGCGEFGKKCCMFLVEGLLFFGIEVLADG